MSHLPTQTRSDSPSLETPHIFNNFASPPRIATTLLGPPVSNLSKQLRANESNSPKLSPIDNVLFGYPPSTPANHHHHFNASSSSTSSNLSTPELSPTHSNASSIPDHAIYTINHQHQFRQMQHWDAHSDAYSNPPSPMSLSPAMSRMTLNPHGTQMAMPIPMYAPTPTPTPPPPTPNSASEQPPTPPPAPTTPEKKIPRPPNAFMIYRSDFLKNGHIPKSVEQKQQTLSRVAGDVWNFMPAMEKKVWRDKAAEVLAEHTRRYPGYKFRPSPKGSKKRTVSGVSKGGEEDSAGAARVRELRERYTPYHGPSPVSSRKRKAKKAHRVEDAKPATSATAGKRAKSYDGDERNVAVFAQPAAPPPPPGVITFANYTMGIGQQHAYHPVHPSPLRNTAAPRRPSTSMGFSESHKNMMFPMHDTRDARISAARNVNGQQMQMQMNGMAHDTGFSIARYENPAEMLSGIFPFGIHVAPTHAHHNPTSSSSEPSSSPSSRYTNMYDPENPFIHSASSPASSSPPPATSNTTPGTTGGLDFSKFDYNGQSYNLSKAIIPPPSSIPSPNAMDASSPGPSATVVRAPSNMNSLTIDVDYRPSMSGGAAASVSASGAVPEGWMFGEMDVEMAHFDNWGYYETTEGGVDANVNVSMGASV